jgi:threonine dehydrogenase-like Zn-dependent dehydrogenase
MKAVVYHGPRDVRVERVPDPRIGVPTDVLVKITTTGICGSDLHMYEGRTGLEPGRVLGHENLGEVVRGRGADIFPTGYHATHLAGVRPGESVVVYGAGPSGSWRRTRRSSRAPTS